MITILTLVLSIIGWIVLMKVWNKYTRRYNYGILRKSKCKNCAEILGDVSLQIAIEKLQKEKEKIKQEAKIGTVKLHNMKLVCPNCATENF